MTDAVFTVEEELVFYDPDLRRSWQEGGDWPHLNHFNFHEAVVAAHFTLRGYHALWDYSATGTKVLRPVARASSNLLQEVVGPEISAFFLNELSDVTNGGSGQPDLFVFREDAPGDPKVRYADPRLWFFAEVKGPGDSVRDNQRTFWREVALRVGPERIRLFRTLPLGEDCEPQVITY